MMAWSGLPLGVPVSDLIFFSYEHNSEIVIYRPSECCEIKPEANALGEIHIHSHFVSPPSDLCAREL